MFGQGLILRASRWKKLSDCPLQSLSRPEEEESVDHEYSPAELKKIERDKIIFEAAATKGASIPEICEILREKGHPASQRTVFYDLKAEGIIETAKNRVATMKKLLCSAGITAQ